MSVDLNFIQALISQESLANLREVQQIVEQELKIAEKGDQRYEKSVVSGATAKYMEEGLPKAGIGPEQTRKTQDLHVSESGATSSHIPLRFDLIPRQLLEIVATTYTEGAKIHTERGYQKGLGDRDFIINRINHIFEHINKLFHPHQLNIGTDEQVTFQGIRENIGAIVWGLAFLGEVLSHDKGGELLLKIVKSGSVQYK